MQDVISRHLSIWEGLEARIGYCFTQRSLLQEAMTHRSFANEADEYGLADYERLEFLGDAVLDLVVSCCLMRDFPDLNEGDLTRLRAEVVAEPSLASLARHLDLGSCMLLGRGEERSGGRSRESLLADAVEALFGAIFSDSDFEQATAVIEPLLLPLLQEASKRSGHDYKTRLQELCQADYQTLPVYRLIEAVGPDHCRRYRVAVYLEGELRGEGDGTTKKKAEQAAARQALERLGL